MLLRDTIYGALREDILACHLSPGEELREQDLAQRYAVSRSPVRDALLRLERESLVSVHPRQGYRVAPVSVVAARDLLRFRALLEPACAALAARNASDADLAGLDAAVAFDGTTQDFIAYNRHFHGLLAEASGNRRMAETARELVGQADRLVRVSLGAMQGRNPERLVAEHAAIAGALRTRDGRRAARLVRAHVEAAERRILDALRRHAVVA